jgi:hypothetical protein
MLETEYPLISEFDVKRHRVVRLFNERFPHGPLPFVGLDGIDYWYGGELFDTQDVWHDMELCDQRSRYREGDGDYIIQALSSSCTLKPNGSCSVRQTSSGHFVQSNMLPDETKSGATDRREPTAGTPCSSTIPTNSSVSGRRDPTPNHPPPTGPTPSSIPISAPPSIGSFVAGAPPPPRRRRRTHPDAAAAAARATAVAAPPASQPPPPQHGQQRWQRCRRRYGPGSGAAPRPPPQPLPHPPPLPPTGPAAQSQGLARPAPRSAEI